MFEEIRDKLRVEWTIKGNPEEVAVDLGDVRWNKHLEKVIKANVESGDYWAWGKVTVVVSLGPFQVVERVAVNCPGGEAEFKDSVLPPIVKKAVNTIGLKAHEVAIDAAFLQRMLEEE